MWHHLTLTSLGVIDSAELELGPGFTVITGETGAGKTMVVTALGLLRGDRADAGLVRHGAKQARVEAEIGVPAGSSVEEAVVDAGGLIDDDVVVLARSLSAQGRSRAFAGGATVPAALLTDITDELVAVHGQSDQHRLLKPSEQRAALDRFAGDPLAKVLDQYRPAHARLREVGQLLDELYRDGAARLRELEALRFGLAEIDAVEPLESEVDDLTLEESRLAHAESLARAAAQAHEALSSDEDLADARARLAAADAALSGAAGHDPELDALAERVRELSILLDDISSELSGYAASVDIDPARLAAIQDRKAALIGLTRKYGPTMADVFEWADNARARAGLLDHDDAAIEELTAERQRLEQQARGLAQQLFELRSEAAARLSQQVDAELAELSMKSAHLEAQVTLPAGQTADDAELGPHGIDRVDFVFAANSGSGLRPLHKGASGGELSRLMLSLEVVLADKSTVPTLVFDEVDAGIGGRAAVEVGRRLQRLAEHAQVIAVTHLPQVAAFAATHFTVTKNDDGVVTSSSVVALDKDERVDELARMLAGQEDSAAARAHARELLELAGR